MPLSAVEAYLSHAESYAAASKNHEVRLAVQQLTTAMREIVRAIQNMKPDA